MLKQEFLSLFQVAVKAAMSARNDVSDSSPEVSRCIDAIKCLKKASASVACAAIDSPTVGKRYELFFHHKNPRIQSEARLLWDLWLSYLYATGRDHNPKVETGDSKRDKLREMLQTALAKVADEVVGAEMKTRVASCDPSVVAVKVESALFDKLGSFLGPHKLKYRSIMFNMKDSTNPDLRRKVLLGEIDGKRLASMTTEEMGSVEIQKEVQKFREKARFREENRLKMMMSESDMITT